VKGRCAGRLVEAFISGELQLLGHPWRFLWMKIQFCSWKGGGGAPTLCSAWRHQLGDLRLGSSGRRLIIDASGCNSPIGALGCVYLHLVRGMFMSVAFSCCTDCVHSGVVVGDAEQSSQGNSPAELYLACRTFATTSSARTLVCFAGRGRPIERRGYHSVRS
jgi:hypothetical protein